MGSKQACGVDAKRTQRGRSFDMRNRLIITSTLVTIITLGAFLRAQTVAKSAVPEPSGIQSSKAADLSGDWGLDLKRGGIGQSISLSDPGGKLRGKEPDIPYQPWSLAKTMSEYPPTGPDARYDLTTDPYIQYCEPLGIG